MNIILVKFYIYIIYMSDNKAFKSNKWKDSTFKKGKKNYNKTRKKKPKLECINMGKYVFCNKNKSKKKKDEKPKAKPQPKPKAKPQPKKSAKEAVMSRAKAPKRKPKTKVKKYDFKEKPKPKPKEKPKAKPRSDNMAKAYMSQVGKYLFKKQEPKINKEFENFFKEMKMFEKDALKTADDLKIKELKKEMKKKKIKSESDFKKFRKEKTDQYDMLTSTVKRLRKSLGKYKGKDYYEKARKENKKTFNIVQKNKLLVGIKDRLKTNFKKLMEKMSS